MRYKTDSTGTLIQCGCGALVTVFNLLAGGWSVDYLLSVFTGKVIPFGWAMLIGLFVGEASVPVAVVVAVLKHFHVF